MIISVISVFLISLLAPTIMRRFPSAGGWLLSILPFTLFSYFLSFLPDILNGQVIYDMLPWAGGNYRLSMMLDGLSLIFALLITGIGGLIFIYAGGYLHGHPRIGRFMMFIIAFMGSMLGVVLSDNIVSLFFFWEMTSITSFLLIGFNNHLAASRRAAIQALVVTGLGGLSLLAGLFVLAHIGASEAGIPIYDISTFLNSDINISGSAAYPIALLLILGGAFTKSAQVPFHFWLPNAMQAPTPVSAYLHSATMVKAGVYLLMRMQPIMGGHELWMTILPIVGAITLVASTMLALKQTDLKLMLAYTTTASLGLLTLLVGTSNKYAILGATAYLIAHSLFKGCLFMVAGAIDHEAGTRDITKLAGLRKYMPWTFGAAILAAISMAGLPPAVGFFAKEELYAGLYKLNQEWLLVMVVIGNAMMLVVGFAVATKPFLGKNVKAVKTHIHEAPWSMRLGPLVLALSGIGIGLFTEAFFGEALYNLGADAIYGHPTGFHWHMFAGLQPQLILSLITLAIGLFIFIILNKYRKLMGMIFSDKFWGPDKGFDQFMHILPQFAASLTRFIQNGDMRRYMLLCLSAIAISVAYPALKLNFTIEIPKLSDFHFYEHAILFIAAMGIMLVIFARSRLTAIVSLGAQGFAVAFIYLLYGAPDLGFTQLMIETLSVVILALVLTRLTLNKTDRRSNVSMLIDGIIAVVIGVSITLTMLMITQQDFDNSLTQFFTQFSKTIAHGANVVNVIIVDFRGFDTLGEISVVMATAISIFALVRFKSWKFRSDQYDEEELL